MTQVQNIAERIGEISSTIRHAMLTAERERKKFIK